MSVAADHGSLRSRLNQVERPNVNPQAATVKQFFCYFTLLHRLATVLRPPKSTLECRSRGRRPELLRPARPVRQRRIAETARDSHAMRKRATHPRQGLSEEPAVLRGSDRPRRWPAVAGQR